jgi:DNA polymerase-4
VSEETPQRKILHVDMDAFYASVEQRDDASLRGRPVVVAWRGARSVVCAASYEARKFGVRSAMPAIRAERLCPQAVFVPPDFVRYKAVSKQVREIFGRHTDLIEPLSLDEAYLDVTQTFTGLPSATATAQAIRAQIREETELTASAGVAPNKFLAKIASDWNKPDGLFVIRPHQVEAFLAPLPVGRLPGVGKVMEAKLAELGVATVSDLRTLGPAALEQRFGRWGRAEPHGRIARTVVLKLKTDDFRILTRSLTPPEPPASLEAVTEIACALRERVDLPSRTRYRLVGVGLSGFIDPDRLAIAQTDLFG